MKMRRRRRLAGRRRRRPRRRARAVRALGPLRPHRPRSARPHQTRLHHRHRPPRRSPLRVARAIRRARGMADRGQAPAARRRGDAGRRGSAVLRCIRASIRSRSRARWCTTSGPCASSKAARRSRSRSRSCCCSRRAGRCSEKAREASSRLRLEHRYTKNEILALYLNLAPYGNRIHGVARASRAYFGCAPEQLTPAQAAFLASLPQRPSAFNPLRDPQRGARAAAAHPRADEAARRGAAARAARNSCGSRRAAQPVLAMHFVERVSATNARGSAPRSTRASSATSSASSPRSARACSSTARTAWPSRCSTTRPASGWRGKARAITSARSFGGAIDGVITPRQPGSTLKPFTYALAFESGHTPATVLADVPSHFPDRRRRRRLHAAQLRRPLSRPAARARRARGIGERARRGDARASSARSRCCASCATPASPASTAPPTTTASA